MSQKQNMLSAIELWVLIAVIDAWLGVGGK